MDRSRYVDELRYLRIHLKCAEICGKWIQQHTNISATIRKVSHEYLVTVFKGKKVIERGVLFIEVENSKPRWICEIEGAYCNADYENELDFFTLDPYGAFFRDDTEAKLIYDYEQKDFKDAKQKIDECIAELNKLR